MKSLPWVDHDNYAIDYNEQVVRVQVADMGRFDERQFLKAFHSRQLYPSWIEEIQPLPAAPASAKEVLANEVLKSLDGEWRTDDVAKRKFWLNIHKGFIRLHTAKHGYWTAIKLPVLDAGKDSIRYGIDAAKGMEMKYERDADTLKIRVSAPRAYAGQYTLYREGADKEK